MKTYRRSFSAFLIATTAMIAPHAIAQQVEPDSDASQESASAEASSASDGAERIVVLGEFIPEPLQATSEVAAFLTDEDLERQGDSSAADALTRVTGLSIAEGRFIYVRGLNERYSAAMLNGSPLPSPEPLKRVVPLDLFPTSILSGVAVQKTYSVEYPGEFGGGIIDLSTLNLPDYPFFEIGSGFSVNPETTLATGYTHDGGDSDRWGVDDGTRKVPALLRQAFNTGMRVSSPNFNDRDIALIGQDFTNAELNLIQVNDRIPGNASIDASGGYRWDIGNFSIGAVGVLGFSNDWKTRDGIQQVGILDAGVLRADSDYNYTTTTNDVGWDGLFGLGVEWGQNKIDWTNLLIRRTSKESSGRFGLSGNSGRFLRTDRTAWYERQLINTQLAGEHEIGEIGPGVLDFNWRAAHAETYRDAPYEKSIVYFFDTSINRFVYRPNASSTNSTAFSELDDTIDSAGIDFSYAIPQSGVRDMVFSAGLDHMDNARESISRSFEFILQNPLSLGEEQQRVDYLLAARNINPDAFVLTETTPSGGTASYDGQLEVTAAFAKIDLEPIQYVRVSIGGRVERGLQRITPQTIFTNDSLLFGETKIKEEYFLPAGTITWNFMEDMQLRFGASKTVGRPQFRELAPQQYRDPDSDRVFFGNPFLVDTEFTNVDARYEYYFDDKQYFTLGVFYKDITNPVESIVVDSGSNLQQSFLNAPAAELIGAEVEIKKIFDEPFANVPVLRGRDLLIQANYTYADSQLKIADGDTVRPFSTLGQPVPAIAFVTDGATLQGQSEHVANLQIGWEDINGATQGTLLVGYVSERSSARGRPGEPDIIQEPGVMVDFTYKQNFDIGSRPMKFSFKAQNLLDEDYDEYQRAGGGEVIVNRYDLGRTFSFGLSTEF